ncbi:MAG TPA: 16S rRNA (guanine(966)-N(2))-methyltransferase RsmD [Candidatus Saccharimonadales bacterium]|nr:16S rRNA (guanine(966)-N(2))-methyltransferase RsmD [Candidatus Saccharimonadales bacterium]
MRIIAGTLGGRTFESPRGHRTHPMSDKVRGALFNALGDLGGLTVLDAFAGSGALSFEAISRGAKQATALDIDKSAITTVVNSAHALGIAEQVKAIRAGAVSWMETQPDATFDIVLLDPPYDDLQPNTLVKLAERATDGGVVVLSLPPTADIELSPTTYRLLSSKSYGDATLRFYRRAA